MGFIESCVAWLVVILFIALIVIGILTFILNWVRPPPVQEETTEEGHKLSIEEVEQRDKEARLKRNIFIVIIAILAVLAATGGINNMMNAYI